MDSDWWRIAPDGAQAEKADGFRLGAQVANGAARFLGLRGPSRSERLPSVPTASGTEDHAHVAMMTAERLMAARSGAVHLPRPARTLAGSGR